MEKFQILIIDLGSQYTLVIGRTLRELGFRSLILRPDKVLPWLANHTSTTKGIILSGGSGSVEDPACLLPPAEILKLGIPILGICLGMQWLAKQFGGTVTSKPTTHKEYGPAVVRLERSTIFIGIEDTATDVWASHGDSVARVPQGWHTLGRSINDKTIAIIADKYESFIGMQFHPEVKDSADGKIMLANWNGSCYNDSMIPDHFQPAIEKIRALAVHDRYIGAFVFGSVARGETNEYSDLDVKVITAEDSNCKEINHPFIGGIKLDITFESLKQITEHFEKEQKAKVGKIPMLAESIILFDKTGELTKLKEVFLKEEPPMIRREQYQFNQFMIYHANNKVERNLVDDPASAMLCMGINVNNLLKIHYRLHKKWRISNKRLLHDLQSWDPELAEILTSFSLAGNVTEKFSYWSKIIDHITIPMGGRQNIEDNNCDCAQCCDDLANLN